MKKKRDLAEPAAVKTVFSALFNESDDYLHAYIRNFLAFTDGNCYLVLNYPVNRPLPPATWEGAGRVFVFNGATPRHIFGHTLLIGHMESYELALQTVGQFDYFCTLASNSLFVRNYDAGEAARKLASSKPHKLNYPLRDLPDTWWWAKVKKNPAFMDLMEHKWGLDHLSVNQIEGFFAAQDQWQLVYDRFDQFKTFGDYISSEFPFPCEEVFPSTLINSAGDGRYIHVVHLFWERGPGARATLKDILTADDKFPPHIFGLKWFDRNPRTIATMAVTRPWTADLLQDLRDARRTKDYKTLFNYSVFLQDLATAVGESNAATPLTTSWADGLRGRNWTFRNPALRSARQIWPLAYNQRDGSAADLPGFVFMEDTKQELSLRIEVSEGESTTAHITCEPTAPAADAGDVIQGFVYFEAKTSGNHLTWRIRLNNPVDPHVVEQLNKLVAFANDKYRAAKPDFRQSHLDYLDLFYGVSAEPGTPIRLGIPLFGKTDMRLCIDLIEG